MSLPVPVANLALRCVLNSPLGVVDISTARRNSVQGYQTSAHQKKNRAVIFSVQGNEKDEGRSGRATGRRVALLGGLLAAKALQTPKSAEAAACELQKAGSLQYCDIRVGKGEALKAGDLVEVVYSGSDVESREVFDASPADEPFEFYLGDDEVLKGWEQGMMGVGNMPPMRYGGVRKLIVPAKLAYGEQGYACKYDLTGKARGGMNCLVNPGSSIELVVGVLEQ
ncbi:hypothetical protein CYMTET_26274 [Cymbomonas tetramitiformis]|uniref:peptidylprolyl isomerase n=1 Tax=Cymbomonas tetramitiformis TaxID=36881 RepID=A0AAE0FSF1_9CHLO|nr:hypothetical protein CYMTET_26274 [Cymbomonas tetramitiformis]